jgi:translocation and assembly module TamA
MMRWSRALNRLPRPAAAALALILGVVCLARAVPYEVAIAGSGATEIDSTIPEISLLAKLVKEPAPDGFALVARARADAERLEDAARSLGYYGATVDIHIDGRPLQDPVLVDMLEAGDPQRTVPVDITIAAGAPYRLRRVAIEGLPADAAIAPTLETGAVARAADVLDAEERLRAELRNRGHAFARIARREVLVDHDARAMDVVYFAEPGPVTSFGTVALNGLARVDESYARRRLGLAEGGRFDPRAIEGARRGLAGTGLFTSVRTTVATAPNSTGRVPVAIDVVERPPRTIGFGAAYSTDEGASVNTRWTHRNLFGKAEQLRLSAEVSRLLRNGPSDTAGRVDAQFRKPDFLIPDLALRVDAGAVRERPERYDRDAVFGQVALERRLFDHVTGRFGMLLERSHITQSGATRDYTLLALPMALEWDDTDDRLEPTRGLRAEIGFTPTQPLSETGAGYWALRGATRFYLDLGAEPGRTVLATRGAIGSILAAERADVPADRRFYAGGGGSVRGYAYQSIGPRDANGEPAGGLSLVEASVELRQRFGESWGAAVFIDAGGAAATRTLRSADLRVGVGAGVRYYTQIGAIRFDVGVPLRVDDDTGRFQIYIGIGQAF